MSQLYPLSRAKFLNGDLDWAAQNFKVVAVDTGLYTYDPAHEFLTSVAAGARVSTSGNLSGKTSTDGVADADDVTLASVTGSSVEALVVYRDSGSAATSELVAYIDSANGLPFTPTGTDVTIRWDDGANKIFKL